MTKGAAAKKRTIEEDREKKKVLAIEEQPHQHLHQTLSDYFRFFFSSLFTGERKSRKNK